MINQTVLLLKLTKMGFCFDGLCFGCQLLTRERSFLDEMVEFFFLYLYFPLLESFKLVAPETDQCFC